VTQLEASCAEDLIRVTLCRSREVTPVASAAEILNDLLTDPNNVNGTSAALL